MAMGNEMTHLLGGSGLAGTNGPDGLVGDNHVGPVTDLVGIGAHLAGDHLVGIASLALLQGLANAGNDLETSCQSMLGLLGDQFVGLLEDGTTLRVAQNDPVDIDVLQHGWRDFASEGTLGLLVGVLAGHADAAGQQVAGVHQIDGRAADDHLGVGVQLGLTEGLADLSNGLLVAVHLPVSTHTEFTSSHFAPKVSDIRVILQDGWKLC